MKKIKVRIKAEFVLFYNHEVKMDEEDYNELKFNPSFEDKEMGLLLLKYCKNQTPMNYLLDDASVVQEVTPKPKTKAQQEKEILIEPLDKDHFKDMQTKARYYSVTLEIKEGYVAVTNGHKDSKEIKTWKNKVFNRTTPEELSLVLKEIVN